VVRDGATLRIAAREVVVEDIMLLAEGDRVPADAELLEGDDLQADESLLTGGADRSPAAGTSNTGRG